MCFYRHNPCALLDGQSKLFHYRLNRKIPHGFTVLKKCFPLTNREKGYFYSICGRLQIAIAVSRATVLLKFNVPAEPNLLNESECCNSKFSNFIQWPESPKIVYLEGKIYIYFLGGKNSIL